MLFYKLYLFFWIVNFTGMFIYNEKEGETLFKNIFNSFIMASGNALLCSIILGLLLE